ncbi:MAG: hypothetical protein ABFD96_01995 [Armatimonadia bacterium]
MDAAVARAVALERQRVMDLAAMARAVELLGEQPPRVQEAVAELLDRMYTSWLNSDGGGDDNDGVQ